MRTIIVFLFFCVSLPLPGQEINDPALASFEVDCEKVKYDAEQDRYQFEGNVHIKMTKLVIEGADKVSYNAQTQEIIAYGKPHFEFDGTVKVKEGAIPKTLHYKPQEQTLYLE